MGFQHLECINAYVGSFFVDPIICLDSEDVNVVKKKKSQFQCLNNKMMHQKMNTICVLARIQYKYARKLGSTVVNCPAKPSVCSDNKL